MTPILQKCLGIKLYRCDKINTDIYGTFTGEIPRIDSMLATARIKAKEAVLRSNCAIGIGSEGAFGPDPHFPFIASGVEIILLYHKKTDHEIYVQKKTQTNYSYLIIRPDEDPSFFLAKIGFPSHAVIIRPEDSTNTSDYIKGVNDPKLLFDSIRYLSRRSKTGRVFIQTDMRAHFNPTRLSMISKLTKHLALRVLRLCPLCGFPGFGKMDVLRGLPCSECGTLTSSIKADVYTCQRCYYTLTRHVRSDSFQVDPKFCHYCNP